MDLIPWCWCEIWGMPPSTAVGFGGGGQRRFYHEERPWGWWRGGGGGLWWVGLERGREQVLSACTGVSVHGRDGHTYVRLRACQRGRVWTCPWG